MSPYGPVIDRCLAEEGQRHRLRVAAGIEDMGGEVRHLRNHTTRRGDRREQLERRGCHPVCAGDRGLDGRAVGQ